jgi:hypothetical protein
MSYQSAMMHMKKLFRPSVGADLSRTPPIYRPLHQPKSPLSCHPEPQRRVSLAGCRDASLRLSMTRLFIDPRHRPLQTVQTAHSFNQKHVNNKPIAVLKNTDQTERYVSAIQSFIEKISNSYDFPYEVEGLHTTARFSNMKCRGTPRGCPVRYLIARCAISLPGTLS